MSGKYPSLTPAQLDLQSAKAKILKILESGRVLITPHCRRQMHRRKVFMPDILRVLKKGELKPGHVDGDDAKGVFRAYGHDNEGDPLAVVVEINEKQNRLKFKTVFGY
jgi:hypothetical protein